MSNLIHGGKIAEHIIFSLKKRQILEICIMINYQIVVTLFTILS